MKPLVIARVTHTPILHTGEPNPCFGKWYICTRLTDANALYLHKDLEWRHTAIYNGHSGYYDTYEEATKTLLKYLDENVDL
jgi:hypothetical protein